ncbi:MAG: bifunctional DNA-formamidopyrimidine glycosylase/DNA-(apurinic or apyrimidinic site) lyase [Bifidobacteriaceae bacterium]|jgi:formamidopyrimidine-DNA glycosylase|nr:bifunctional DNA-formamidopyrimidine glycosylase/DNA-(apurinic or apyrimidinic site) lyase [Bifidobacteriaceae bacterium]
MPELPEVETVRRGLERLIVGKQFTSAEVLEPKSFLGDPRGLAGRTVRGLRRRGKVLVIELDQGLAIAIHLKMTGQLVYRGPDEGWGGGHPNDSLVGGLPDGSTRVVLHLEGGADLFFNDQRKFGWLMLTEADAVDRLPLLVKMGPEPLEGNAWPQFHQRIRRHPKIGIKAALLNQEIVAGIGNIYADEALWGARVHPESLVGQLSDKKLKTILESAIAAMELSLEKGGSTDRNYVDAEGRRGAYLDFANVFRRQGLPCKRCSRPIVKTRVAGRGTHICTNCQRRARGIVQK